MLRTRRPYARGASSRRVAFGGFPILHAREQSGAIGVMQSANLWVAPASLQGLRRIPLTSLPQELRERPAISLAFEFLDQPFGLALDVEDSPPLVRSQSRTLFHLDADRARSESTIELQWVRGRLFEVELGLGPGLEVVSVGPPDVVEAWNPTGASTRRPGNARAGEPPGLTIRLAPTVRDQSKVTIRLDGFQRLPRDGPVKLGLFAPDETTAVSASFTVAGDRGLSVELDDDATRSGRAGGTAGFRLQEVASDRSTPPSGGSAGGPALVVEAAGSPRTLPIRITRHARSVRQETTVTAEVSRRGVEILQKTMFAVRHGTLAALEVRVPAAIADSWELLDREVVDRADLPRDADGSRRYRLYFDRPLLDRTTLTFRCRMPIAPALDAAGSRDLTLPWIGFPEAAAGPVRVEVSTAPGVVFRERGSGVDACADAHVGCVIWSAGVGRVRDEPGLYRGLRSAGAAVQLSGRGARAGHPARAGRPPLADRDDAGLRRLAALPGLVLGRDARAGVPVCAARGCPDDRVAGQWPGGGPGRLRARAGRVPAAAAGRDRRAARRGRAGIPARRIGRARRLARARTPRRRPGAPDPLAGADALGPHDPRCAGRLDR